MSRNILTRLNLFFITLIGFVVGITELNDTDAKFDSCYFEDFGNSAVFDTGEPYQNDMRRGLHISL